LLTGLDGIGDYKVTAKLGKAMEVFPGSTLNAQMIWLLHQQHKKRCILKCPVKKF